jgi:hypothetical protein
MAIRPKNHDVTDGGRVFGRLSGVGQGKPSFLDANELHTILLDSGYGGAKFMDIDQLTPGSSGDLFPLDGAGATTPTASSSDLAASTLCVIDGIIARFNSSGFTVVLKDALGVQIGNDLDFITPMPQPMSIQLAIPIAVLGGFTAEVTAAAGGSITVTYRDLS